MLPAPSIHYQVRWKLKCHYFSSSLRCWVLCAFMNDMSWPRWRGGATRKAFGLAISRSRVQILLEASLCNNLRQVVFASVTKQYNLVPAKGWWCSAAGEVTAGLAESNGSLPLVGWLRVTCRLTACTPGSAPGPTLGVEYGKPLPFMSWATEQHHCQLSEAAADHPPAWSMDSW